MSTAHTGTGMVQPLEKKNTKNLDNFNFQLKNAKFVQPRQNAAAGRRPP